MKSNDEAQSEAPSVETILDELAEIGRGWVIDQLDGTSFIKDALDGIEEVKAETTAKINRLIAVEKLQIKANVWQQFKDAMMKQELSARPPEGARFRTPLEELTLILEREIPLSALSNNLSKGDVK